MARRPEDHAWFGFSTEQGRLLNFIDHLGNNGWARNSQTDELMPGVISEALDLGMSINDVKRAMDSIGYSKSSLHALDRWHSKVTTGRFGR